MVHWKFKVAYLAVTALGVLAALGGYSDCGVFW